MENGLQAVFSTTHISPPFQQNPPLKHSLSVPKARRFASKQEERKLSYLIMYHFLNASTIKQRVISTMTTHLPSNKEMIFRHITNAAINFIS